MTKKIKDIKSLLELHEDRRKFPYVDTVGKVSIGIGHNLTDLGLTDSQIDAIFEIDMAEALRTCNRLFPHFNSMDPVRRLVLLDMAFNMGFPTFSKFFNTIGYINEGRWAEASVNMLKSKWARQVGQRAQRLARMMRTGEYPDDPRS